MEKVVGDSVLEAAPAVQPLRVSLPLRMSCYQQRGYHICRASTRRCLRVGEQPIPGASEAARHRGKQIDFRLISEPGVHLIGMGSRSIRLCGVALDAEYPCRELIICTRADLPPQDLSRRWSRVPPILLFEQAAASPVVAADLATKANVPCRSAHRHNSRSNCKSAGGEQRGQPPARSAFFINSPRVAASIRSTPTSP
jgi:hypothetical protein